MQSTFGTVKNWLRSDRVSIDNHLFRLHYKVTTWIVLVFVLIIGIQQYLGK